jgi:hypothetical protein
MSSCGNRAKVQRHLLRNVARLKGSPSASRAGLLGPEQAPHGDRSGTSAIASPFELNQVRRCRNGVAGWLLARIPDRLSEHGVKLTLAGLFGLPFL